MATLGRDLAFRGPKNQMRAGELLLLLVDPDAQTITETEAIRCSDGEVSLTHPAELSRSSASARNRFVDLALSLLPTSASGHFLFIYLADSSATLPVLNDCLRHVSRMVKVMLVVTVHTHSEEILAEATLDRQCTHSSRDHMETGLREVREAFSSAVNRSSIRIVRVLVDGLMRIDLLLGRTDEALLVPWIKRLVHTESIAESSRATCIVGFSGDEPSGSSSFSEDWAEDDLKVAIGLAIKDVGVKTTSTVKDLIRFVAPDLIGSSNPMKSNTSTPVKPVPGRSSVMSGRDIPVVQVCHRRASSHEPKPFSLMRYPRVPVPSGSQCPEQTNPSMHSPKFVDYRGIQLPSVSPSLSNERALLRRIHDLEAENLRLNAQLAEKRCPHERQDIGRSCCGGSTAHGSLIETLPFQELAPFLQTDTEGDSVFDHITDGALNSLQPRYRSSSALASSNAAKLQALDYESKIVELQSKIVAMQISQDQIRARAMEELEQQYEEQLRQERQRLEEEFEERLRTLDVKAWYAYVESKRSP